MIYGLGIRASVVQVPAGLGFEPGTAGNSGPSWTRLGEARRLALVEQALAAAGRPLSANR